MYFNELLVGYHQTFTIQIIQVALLGVIGASYIFFMVSEGEPDALPPFFLSPNALLCSCSADAASFLAHPSCPHHHL